MFYVYIIYSEAVNKYYIGQTDNLNERLDFHNSGISRYTAISKGWALVYTESYETRTEAVQRENQKEKKSKIH